MSTKPKTTTKPKANSAKQIKSWVKQIKGRRDKKPSVELAREVHVIASLLWRKILVNSTPEVREMLFVHDRPADFWDRIAPNDYERVPHTPLTHGNLLDLTDKAQFLLTGATRFNTSGLPEGYEKGLSEDQGKAEVEALSEIQEGE